MMSNRKTAIGINPELQTVVVVFPEPLSQLSLSPEQAEEFGKALIERAKQLKIQQSN